MSPEELANLRNDAEAANRDWFSTEPTPALRRYHEATQPAVVLRLLAEVERLNAEVDSQARQIAARSGETTGERLFKELATAKQADLTKAEARIERVRALLIPNMYSRDEANRLLNRIRDALDGEATE